MAMTNAFPAGETEVDVRERVERIIADLDHILPGQAPILDFVHHNTLHGFQHLPFEQALSEVERLTGIRAYQSEEEFRRCYAAQRIDDEDIDAALNDAPDLEPDTVLLEIGDSKVHRRHIYRLAMIYGIEPTTPEQLRWSSEECGVFERIMDDIPPSARHRLLQAIKLQSQPSGARVPSPSAFVRALWNACAEKLGLSGPEAHPDDVIDLGLDGPTETTAGGEVARSAGLRDSEPLPRGADVDEMLARIGDQSSLVALLAELTGTNGLDTIRPSLIRFAA
jgi:hypothetical protein